MTSRAASLAGGAARAVTGELDMNRHLNLGPLLPRQQIPQDHPTRTPDTTAP